MSIKATIVPLPDIPTARYSFIAHFIDANEYIKSGKNLKDYNPTSPPLDQVVLYINDGDDGEMEISIHADDEKLSVKMVDGCQWCDCDPSAFIGLTNALQSMYTNLKSGKVTCEDIIHGNIQDILS